MDLSSRSRENSLRGIEQANERMQLTWLLGAPNRPVSAHRLVVGRPGLGSPATQLMRAVRPQLPGRVAWRWRCRAEAGRASGPCMAERSAAPAGFRAESLCATEECARFG